MIVFEKITMKNFMSVGNDPLEINYLAARTNLVTATNGVGKSSVMLDSLVFALYGCPYRPINKPQLINSINGKGLVVELYFRVGKTKYKVIRGIKPNIFEIYKNDQLINQDAVVRDYQRFLETNILKMNYRTFSQIVIMGSGNYIPFMRLNPAQRREFIEDILDIKVFSTMNQLLKEKIKNIEEESKLIENEYKTIKEKIKIQDHLLKTLSDQRETHVEGLRKQIQEITEQSNVLSKEVKTLVAKAKKINDEDVSNVNQLTKSLNELKTSIAVLDKNYVEVDKKKHFFNKIKLCPTCSQDIDEKAKGEITGKIEKELERITVEKSALARSMDKMTKNLSHLKEKQDALQAIQLDISNKQSAILYNEQTIENLRRQEKSSQKNSLSTIDDEKKKLKTMANEAIKLKEKKHTLEKENHYLDLISIMLKDSGIKTKIIKQYIPRFNKLINAYLQQLDMFVSFNLDENFNETIKSRYRDNFTYDSFSEGEKQRIDIALAFSFRSIASMKNAVNVNLLILDEILDQSLDMNGIDMFFKLIDDLDKTNLYVISHREGVEDKFYRNIRLAKKNNFTILDDVT